MPSERSIYEPIARDAARRAGINPELFVRQVEAESSWNPNAISRDKQGNPIAYGIAQIVPRYHPTVDPLDPVAALRYAARLMRSHLSTYGGDYKLALAAYNAGPGNVRKYGGVPPFRETVNYINRILGPGIVKTTPTVATAPAEPGAGEEAWYQDRRVWATAAAVVAALYVLL